MSSGHVRGRSPSGFTTATLSGDASASPACVPCTAASVLNGVVKERASAHRLASQRWRIEDMRFVSLASECKFGRVWASPRPGRRALSVTGPRRHLCRPSPYQQIDRPVVLRQGRSTRVAALLPDPHIQRLVTCPAGARFCKFHSPRQDSSCRWLLQDTVL